MKRILIVVPNWIGDALFATAALRRIKAEYPQAQCAVLAVPRAAEVFQRNPDVAQILINQEGQRPFWYPIELILKLGKWDFDAAFFFHRSRSRAICAFLAGIPLRIGHDAKGRGLFLSHAQPEPSRPMHRLDDLRNLLNQIGLAGDLPHPVFVVSDAARARMRQNLAQAGWRTTDRSQPLILLNPGGNWPPKRWPARRFAQLADALASGLNAKIGITGAMKDRLLFNQIQSEAAARLICLAGRTDLDELGAAIQCSSLFVSSDSGPMHLAAAMGTPLVALFGPTSPAITGPRGPGKITVLHKDIGLPVPNPDADSRDMRYMEAITVEGVFQAAQEILKRPVPPLVPSPHVGEG